MPRKSKSTGTSLFNREIHGKGRFNIPGYWKKRLEVDFGIQIDSKETYQLYQNYHEYYVFIQSVIDELPAIQPRDIRDFLCDKNIGQGELQIHLLKLLLTKSGAKEACAWIDNRGSSALSVAIGKDNTKAFEMVKNHLTKKQREMFLPSLTKEFKRKRMSDSESLSRPAYEFDGNIQSLAKIDDPLLFKSAKDTLSTNAKEFFLKERERYNRNILHLLCQSGSIRCLQFLMNELNQDISQLYYFDNIEKTPAFYIVINDHSAELLKMVLKFSPFNLNEELFEHKDGGVGFTLFEWIMSVGNMEMIHYITNLVGTLDSSIKETYQSDNVVISSIQDIETGLPFFVLSKDNFFEPNSLFIQHYNTNKDNLFFTVRVSIDKYLQQQELNPDTTPGFK